MAEVYSDPVRVRSQDFIDSGFGFNPVNQFMFSGAPDSMEIDQFVYLQNQSLRIAMQEQQKRHTAILLRKLELGLAPLLVEKDEEIARLSKNVVELEDFLRILEMESHAWKKIAKEKEEIAVSLNNKLTQMRDNSSGVVPVDDAESCLVETRENKASMKGNAFCHSCGSRNSCVLFLPCRHLCSCRDCEIVLASCPICRTSKKATVVVLPS